MAQRPYLDYYISNKIIPVRQDISQIDTHLKRRSLLYHHLHIPPNAVHRQRVLEVGPGTGDNAVHTASLLPARYVFVDGNPYSIAALKARIADDRYRFSEIPELEVVECDFFEYRDERRFDLVLCEGIVPGQTDGAGFLRHAASLVDEGGLLVITTMTATSTLAEVCRRLLKPIFASLTTTPEQLFERLCACLEPHFDTLPGRSRLAEDWIRDNILQPWPRSIIFTLPDALDAIGDEFEVHGTSPQFIQDFRWYKSAAIDSVSVNDVARTQWAKWAPTFLDYRLAPDTAPAFDGSALEAECLAILIDAHEAWQADDKSKVAACVDRIMRFGEWISPQFPFTGASVRDYVGGMTAALDEAPPEFAEFKFWFGRGQQYVSFLRRD